MFSVQAASACTSTGSFSSATDAAAASTAAAPAMSVFMSSMPSLVFSDRPPESNVTPLPTMTMRRRAPGGVQARWMKRGSCVLPCATAR